MPARCATPRRRWSACAASVFDELAGDGGADKLKEKLEQAGFGDRTKPTAASVLERLKQARTTTASPPSPPQA